MDILPEKMVDENIRSNTWERNNYTKIIRFRRSAFNL